jgi:hypothetical protein
MYAISSKLSFDVVDDDDDDLAPLDSNRHFHLPHLTLTVDEDTQTVLFTLSSAGFRCCVCWYISSFGWTVNTKKEGYEILIFRFRFSLQTDLFAWMAHGPRPCLLACPLACLCSLLVTSRFGRWCSYYLCVIVSLLHSNCLGGVLQK